MFPVWVGTRTDESKRDRHRVGNIKQETSLIHEGLNGVGSMIGREDEVASALVQLVE